jgi:FMNH2-dependent dimethyl sulfone monooxygenase
MAGYGAEYRLIVARSDTEAVRGFDAAVRQAGRSASDGKGMWQGPTSEAT